MVSPDDITAALNMMANETAKDLVPALQKVMDNMIMKDMLPKDAMAMDPRTVEATYAQAYHHYNTGQFKEAARLFQFLVLIDATEPKFGLGLAACHQMLEEYQNALQFYGVVEIIDPENPIPHFHSSDCYEKMGLSGAAIAELEMTVELCGTQPHYSTMKERALLTIKSLQEKLPADALGKKTIDGNGEKK